MMIDSLIYKMFLTIKIGVQTAETELSTSKVTVTGTMDADRLVDYVYRRTKKQARIVPQPELEKQEENKAGEKPAEEAKPEEKKEESAEKAEEGKPPEAAKKEGEEGNGGENNENKEEKSDENKEEVKAGEIPMDDETMKRMMYYYQPLYVIERIPPPQLFSDENPNACCIS